MLSWLTSLGPLRWQDLLDVALVAFVLHRAFLLVRGTRASQLLRGLLVILIAYVIAAALELKTIMWLAQSLATMLIVAIPVVFQPELRRALFQLGQAEWLRGELPFPNRKPAEEEGPTAVVDEVVAAVRGLARARRGALIIFERQTGLAEFVETGSPLDAVVGRELLEAVFFPNAPLHDGAVILRGDRLAAAGVVLPLSEGLRARGARAQGGTRHRAAIGLTETTDALAVVVSEETGTVSLAIGGQLRRHLSEEALREALMNHLSPAGKKPQGTQPLGLPFVPRRRESDAQQLKP